MYPHISLLRGQTYRTIVILSVKAKRENTKAREKPHTPQQNLLMTGTLRSDMPEHCIFNPGSFRQIQIRQNKTKQRNEIKWEINLKTSSE